MTCGTYVGPSTFLMWSNMTLTSIYPVLMTDDVATTAQFFRDLFDFEPTFESDWYVSLRCHHWELAVVRADHPTVPDSHRATASGILLNFEVDDVDAEYRRLVVDGPLEPLLSLRSETFGQRHFIVRGPAGVLIDVITEISPEGEYADGFVDESAVG
jgi:catechol 2,3-dioxygenase-like lactoylglutathione lyase family enzyme